LSFPTRSTVTTRPIVSPASVSRASRTRRSITTAIALGAGALIAIAVPLSASAHVTVTPNSAEAGSYSLLTFKVPTESATASTVKIEVELPTKTPLASVSYVPVAGWTTTLTTETLPTPVKVGENEITEAITKVTWVAAAGSGVQPGQLQLFPLSVGPIPDTGKLVLPATQTYSDGTVVNWNGTGDDAEHPAPTLFVNEQPPADHHGGGASVSAEHDPASADGDSSTGSEPSTDPIARGLGIAGLVVGAVGIVLAVVGRRRAV